MGDLRRSKRRFREVWRIRGKVQWAHRRSPGSLERFKWWPDGIGKGWDGDTTVKGVHKPMTILNIHAREACHCDTAHL